MQVIKDGRNHGKQRSTEAEIKARILAGLAALRKHDYAMMSGLAYMGLPDLEFANPQGAALAICRVVRKMWLEGTIHRHEMGWQISYEGRRQLSEANANKERE